MSYQGVVAVAQMDCNWTIDVTRFVFRGQTEKRIPWRGQTSPWISWWHVMNWWFFLCDLKHNLTSMWVVSCRDFLVNFICFMISPRHGEIFFDWPSMCVSASTKEYRYCCTEMSWNFVIVSKFIHFSSCSFFLWQWMLHCWLTLGS